MDSGICDRCGLSFLSLTMHKAKFAKKNKDCTERKQKQYL